MRFFCVHFVYFFSRNHGMSLLSAIKNHGIVFITQEKNHGIGFTFSLILNFALLFCFHLKSPNFMHNKMCSVGKIRKNAVHNKAFYA